MVYLPLLISVLAGVAAGPLSVRLDPRHATWLLTAAALILAASSTAALALLAATAAARLPSVAAFGHYSLPAMRYRDPTAVPTALAAAAALGGLALATLVALRRRARALARAYRRAGDLPGHHELVILPEQGVQAYALPGWPGRIVVSTGTLSALDSGGRRALLAHEKAHLTGRHHLFSTLAHLAAAANPLLRPLAHAVDYTIERWADEGAARVVGDRRLVATTIGRTALLASRHPAPMHTTAALGINGGWTHGIRPPSVGPVPRRVAALLAPPPPRHTALIALAAIIVLAAAVSALNAAQELHALVDLAQDFQDLQAR
jgi:Zn-dependent protease with chaperone function